MGSLILIPTPIGNLEDITLRALKALKEVDIILAEDSRNTSFLLKHFSIATKIISYHQHNEHKLTPQIIEELAGDKKYGLVTDAGTPGISDPGFLLVRACIKNNIHVECLPGPTAFVPALVVSGLPCNEFFFAGFLPHKKGRETKIKALSALHSTIIIYESPHRIKKTIDQMIPYFGGERNASISREISKMFEETIRGTLIDLKTQLENKDIKGELVMVIQGTE